MPEMLVSIIIPCYNNEQYIAEAIESALNQSYPATEVIVVDDGSTDSSLEIIRSYGDRIQYFGQKNQGAPVARNFGLARARGEYVKFLDGDDALLPDCIERQVRQFEDLDPAARAIVTGNVQAIDERGNNAGQMIFRPKEKNESSIYYMLVKNPPTAAPLHRKEYLKQIGGFDPSMIKGQEWDLHLRLALSGVEFIHYPQITYRYRQHFSHDNISQNWLLHDPMTMFRIHQKHEALIRNKLGGELPPEYKEYFAKKYWRYGRAVLQGSNEKEAQFYFDRAVTLGGQKAVDGKFIYTQLVQIMGPVRSEKVLQGIKSLKGKFKSMRYV